MRTSSTTPEKKKRDERGGGGGGRRKRATKPFERNFERINHSLPGEGSQSRIDGQTGVAAQIFHRFPGKRIRMFTSGHVVKKRDLPWSGNSSSRGEKGEKIYENTFSIRGWRKMAWYSGCGRGKRKRIVRSGAIIVSFDRADASFRGGKLEGWVLRVIRRTFSTSFQRCLFFLSLSPWYLIREFETR